MTGADKDPAEDVVAARLARYVTPRARRTPRAAPVAVGQMLLLPADSEVSDRRNGPGSDRHAIDPLEVLHDTLVATAGMMRDGYHADARLWLRQQLEGMLRYMCPVCGRTDDHEAAWPDVHRYVAPRQRELKS